MRAFIVRPSTRHVSDPSAQFPQSPDANAEGFGPNPLTRHAMPVLQQAFGPPRPTEMAGQRWLKLNFIHVQTPVAGWNNPVLVHPTSDQPVATRVAISTARFEQLKPHWPAQTRHGQLNFHRLTRLH